MTINKRQIWLAAYMAAVAAGRENLGSLLAANQAVEDYEGIFGEVA